MGGFGSGHIEKPELRLFRKICKDKFGCWVVGRSRYYSFNFLGKVMGAHRASYLMFKGSIPKGTLVMHRCDNKSCVNPDHLNLGTPLDNMQDMRAKNRQGDWKRIKRKCLRGHDLTKESNIYINPTRGDRRCRACIKIYRRK